MRISTPVITLIVGLALAASLLVSSMSAVSAKKAALAQAAAASPAASAAAPASTGSTGGTAGTGTAGTAATPSASGSGFTVPPHANYVGQVMGNKGSVAVVVHDTFAVAYFCNGSTQEAWLRGTPHNGKLSMTGKGNAKLTMSYALGHARGQVTVHGISYTFSIIAVHKPSGLYQSIATVRGATVKAGWIVLADGSQVGAIEPDSNQAVPVARTAPALDVGSLTARDGGTTLTAHPIDGETGSGF
jgi:serine/threonine-protein kinase